MYGMTSQDVWEDSVLPDCEGTSMESASRMYINYAQVLTVTHVHMHVHDVGTSQYAYLAPGLKQLRHRSSSGDVSPIPHEQAMLLRQAAKRPSGYGSIVN